MLLVAGIHNFRISEPTGRGIQIAHGIYVTNECSAQLDRLLSRPLRFAIGGNECASLLTGSAAVYWKELANEPDPIEAGRLLTMWLQCLRAFFMAIWVVRDNAVNVELGFIEHEVPGQGITHGSNFIAALFSNARGDRDIVAFSLAELRRARDYFSSFFLPIMFGLQPNGGGVFDVPIDMPSRPAIISARGVHRLPRLLYFLTAARGETDLGVKVSLYMTCLEIMFSTDSTELSHRLSERVAFFLYRSPAERLTAYKRLKRAYNIRSKVIHGSVISQPIQKELPEVSADVDDLLRELVLKILSDESAKKVFDMEDAEFEDYFAKLTMGISEDRVRPN